MNEQNRKPMSYAQPFSDEKPILGIESIFLSTLLVENRESSDEALDYCERIANPEVTEDEPKNV